MTRRSPRDLLRLARDEPDDDHAQSIFLRGLSLGALIGAAIAGSAIWERRRIKRAAGESPRPPKEEPPAA